MKLIKKLSINQGQTIRKAAPKVGSKKELWEHAIPTKVITDELIKMVLEKDLTHLRKLLQIYQLAGQRGVTKEEDDLLKKYRNCMPEGWNWKDEEVDPLVRYKMVGIECM